MLEEERSELDLSIRSFGLGSTVQTAVEVIVINTNETEEEEDKMLKEIAMETRRLEELELEVSPYRQFADSGDYNNVRGIDSGNEVAYGMAQGDSGWLTCAITSQQEGSTTITVKSRFYDAFVYTCVLRIPSFHC